jgi:hypothetical protein
MLRTPAIPSADLERADLERVELEGDVQRIA